MLKTYSINWVFIEQIWSSLVSVLVIFCCGFFASPEEFGAVSGLIAGSFILEKLFSLSFDKLLISGRFDYNLLSAACGTIIVLFTLLYPPFLTFIASPFFNGDVEMGLQLFILSSAIIFRPLSSLLVVPLRIKRRFDIIAKRQIYASLLAISATFSVFLFFNHSVTTLLVGFRSAQGFVLLIAAILIIGKDILVPPNFGELCKVMKQRYQTPIADILAVLAKQGDKIVVIFVLGEQLAGLYNMGLRIVSLVSSCLGPVFAKFYLSTFKYKAANLPRGAYLKYVRKSFKRSLTMSAVTLLIISSGAGYVVHLLDNDWFGIVYFLPVLSIIGLLQISSLVSSTYFLTENIDWMRLLIQAIKVITLFPILVFIPNSILLFMLALLLRAIVSDGCQALYFRKVCKLDAV